MGGGGHFANDFGRFVLFGNLCLLFELVFFQAGIPGRDYAFDLRELPGFLCDTHGICGVCEVFGAVDVFF